ncbi:aspartyl protease family protein [Olleya sp. R77988]|uniref:aspartyl protease family protein n=1 Tax=Olleya sp. R77988 TaxID=3093875 RepID=UPI0037C8437C
MFLRKLYIIIVVFCCFSATAQNQYIIEDDEKSNKIRFELVNNLIIIPVEVNGLSLKFVLDTGVNKPIVFNFLKASDSLKVLNAEKIQLKGLGDGNYIDALRSSHNTFKVGDAVNNDQAFYAIFDSSLNFAPILGVTIDGIIGYDLFKDFIVEINYTSKFIRLHNPETYNYKKCKKCESFNLEFEGNKPYLEGEVSINSNTIPVKLLIDSGGSDALWLFENTEKGLKMSKNYFTDFLGAGLNGNVFGKRTKIEAFNIGNFSFKNPKVAYPDSITVASVKKFKDRDGTFGGELLKRFNSIIDYPNSKITLKPNSFFKRPFRYNRSGLQVVHDGVRLVMEIDVKDNGLTKISGDNGKLVNVQSVIKTNYKYDLKPYYIINEVRMGSPGYNAGLRKGDIVNTINGKETYDMSLSELVGYFYQNEGVKIKLVVDRLGLERRFEFKLQSPIK